MRIAKALTVTVSSFVISNAATAATPPKTPVGPTTAVYFDISTPDLEKAKAFYGELLGWTFQPGPTPGFRFALIFDHGKLIGDLAEVKTVVGKNGGVAMYFPVADVRASFARALALGAEVVYPPMNVPSADVDGAIAMVRDPAGNPVGLYSPKPL